MRERSQPSLDHFVGARQQRCGNFDADRLGRLQVDDELESRRQLDRHLGWFLAVEDAADVDGRLAKLVRKVGPVAHQPASLDQLASMVQCRERMTHGQRDDLHAAGDEQRLRALSLR